MNIDISLKIWVSHFLRHIKHGIAQCSHQMNHATLLRLFSSPTLSKCVFFSYRFYANEI